MYKFVSEDRRYYYFENGNKYEKGTYTKETAQVAVNTLIDCKNCTNCESSNNLTSCTNVQDSKNSTYCYNSKELENCDNCKDSRKLKNSQKSHACVNGEDLYACNRVKGVNIVAKKCRYCTNSSDIQFSYNVHYSKNTKYSSTAYFIDGKDNQKFVGIMTSKQFAKIKRIDSFFVKIKEKFKHASTWKGKEVIVFSNKERVRPEGHLTPETLTSAKLERQKEEQEKTEENQKKSKKELLKTMDPSLKALMESGEGPEA